MFVIVEDNKVVTVNVNNSVFPMSIEAPDDIIFGDKYENGEFQRIAPRPEPLPPEPQAPSTEDRLTAVEEALLMIL